MAERNISAAPNYTMPALVMMGVNLMWMFFALWALYGFLPVIIMALLLHVGINRLERRRG